MSNFTKTDQEDKKMADEESLEMFSMIANKVGDIRKMMDARRDQTLQVLKDYTDTIIEQFQAQLRPQEESESDANYDQDQDDAVVSDSKDGSDKYYDLLTDDDGSMSANDVYHDATNSQEVDNEDNLEDQGAPAEEDKENIDPSGHNGEASRQHAEFKNMLGNIYSMD